MNPLTQIPTRVRGWIYCTYALVGLFLGGCQVAEVDHLGQVDIVKALAVLAYVGTGLGLTAASNLGSTSPNVTTRDLREIKQQLNALNRTAGQASRRRI